MTFEWITYFKDLGVPQFIMLVIFFLIAWKMGLFNGKKNGNGSGITHENHAVRIVQLEEHAKIANSEMGEVKVSIAKIETDVGNIKGSLERIENKL